ncbi:triose-phosphate isomerase [Candidatus Peribacteria bacterium]|nr:triose-phosphate isomerase [Candidatus Peribacteria bacterium]
MAFPLWITNYKAYEQARGAHAVGLSVLHAALAEELQLPVTVAVSALDLHRVATAVPGMPLCVQHLDPTPAPLSSSVGCIAAPLAREAGATYALLNHAAHRIEDRHTLAETIKEAQESEIITIVCAATVAEVAALQALGTDAIAYEPPELIGSNQTSVSRAQPEVVRAAVIAAAGVPLLIGAGVATAEDVRIGMQLGCSGFLVASAIVKAPDPAAALRTLLTAMKNATD